MVPDPPELATKTPRGRMVIPKPKIKINKYARLPNMKFLHATHEIFLASN
jgi:hypothetical protein